MKSLVCRYLLLLITFSQHGIFHLDKWQIYSINNWEILVLSTRRILFSNRINSYGKWRKVSGGAEENRNERHKIHDLFGKASGLINHGEVQKELSLSYLARNQDPSWAPATLY